jgi:hypothetical protein
MTDIFAPAVAASPARAEERHIPRGLFRFAGVALTAFPLLFAGGMLFSPAQTEPGEAGYIASLAADPAASLLSANLLHYAWVALALGVMGVIGLVGRRGRAWVSIAAVVVALGAVQMSGLLLSDWFLIAAGNTLPMEQALALDGAAKELSVVVWLMSAQVATMLGIPALTLGLARARVVSWWIAPLPLLAFIVPMFNLGPIAAIAFVPLMAPVIVAGVKLIRHG